MGDLRACELCSKPFVSDESWMRKCIICWKNGAKYDLTKSDKAFAAIQGETDRLQKDVVKLQAELRKVTEELDVERSKPPRTVRVKPPAADGLSQERIRQLIRLTHPDRHGNSELSNELTKWLLSMRKKE